MDEAKYKEVTDLRLDILKLQSLVEQAESTNCEIRPTITYNSGNSVVAIPKKFFDESILRAITKLVLADLRAKLDSMTQRYKEL